MLVFDTVYMPAPFGAFENLSTCSFIYLPPPSHSIKN